MNFSAWALFCVMPKLIQFYSQKKFHSYRSIAFKSRLDAAKGPFIANALRCTLDEPYCQSATSFVPPNQYQLAGLVPSVQALPQPEGY
jgi:hypothetical protein